jgi:hypothetical protein
VTALVALVAAALLVSGVGRLGEAVVDSARAQSAADAVALAAIDAGGEQARRVATIDGADDVLIDVMADDVMVEVRVDGRVGRARASAAP